MINMDECIKKVWADVIDSIDIDMTRTATYVNRKGENILWSSTGRLEQARGVSSSALIQNVAMLRSLVLERQKKK